MFVPLLITWKCVPLVDLLNALLWAGRKGPATYTRYFDLGCSYHLHSSHCFLSTWGAVMLEKEKKGRTLFPGPSPNPYPNPIYTTCPLATPVDQYTLYFLICELHYIILTW